MEDKVVQARKVYETICQHLDRQNWHYNKNEEKLQISFKIAGDDLPVEIVMDVDAEREIVRAISILPFKMCEEKRIEGALAITAINYKLANGCFDYDLSDGFTVFRLASYYGGAEVSDALIQYMIGVTYATANEYNDKLLMLNKGMLKLEEFLN